MTIAFFEFFKGIRGHSLVILNKKMLCFGNCSCLFQNMVDWSVSLVFSMKYASIAKRKIEKRQENCIQTSGTYGKLYKHVWFIGFRLLVFCLRSSLCCRPFTHRRIVTIADGRSGYAVLVCNNERRGKLCINDQRGKQLNVQRKFREACSTDRSSMLIPTRILIKPDQLIIFFNCNRNTLTISWNYLFSKRSCKKCEKIEGNCCKRRIKSIACRMQVHLQLSSNCCHCLFQITGNRKQYTAIKVLYTHKRKFSKENCE